ncbi:MAG TPA: sulfite exporter TauE/SafE family protein [Pseudomonadales bacterium]|nr:sulfite exporter TauE/SafE family protein [Pseudomonadales bacterium]
MNSDWYLPLSSACLLGFMSSGHCLGMCGGISCALGLQQHRNPKAALLLYHCGRICTYTLLALAFGASLQHTLHQFPLLSPWLRTMTGLVLLAMALHIARWWSGITALEKIGARWWKPLQKIARPLLPAEKYWQIFALGLLSGWLPCALVYSTLTWAASRADATQAAALMFCFGLGTTPALFASGVFAENLKQIMQQKKWRYSAALLLALCALWTIAAAWQHAGHTHH